MHDTHTQRPEEILRAATLALTQTLDLDTVLARLLEYLEQLVPYDAANVMLRVSGSQIAMLAMRGYEQWADPEQVRAATYDIDTDQASRQIFTNRRSMVIPDTAVYDGWVPTKGTEFVRCWMAVPLIADRDMIGVLSLDKAEPNYFSAEHLRLAEMLAAHAVIAIQNARLHEQLRQQTQDLEAANRALTKEIATRTRAEQALRLFAEMSTVLAFSLDYSTTLKNIATMVVPQMADYCLIHLIDSTGQYVQVASAHVLAQKALLLERLGEIYRPHSDRTPEVIRRAMAAHSALLVDATTTDIAHDLMDDAEVLEIYRVLQPLSYLVIPLIVRGELRGALTLARSDSAIHYADDDLALAEELGPRLALAIDNAQLQSEAQLAIQRLNESLALLNTVLISAPIGFAFQDRELRFVHINAALAQLNGLAPEQHLGRTLLEVHPRTAALVEPLLRQVLQSGQPVIDLDIHGSSPGSTVVRYWLASYYPVRTSSGVLIGVGTLVNEITPRRHAEDDLRRQKEILQHIFDHAPMMLAFYDADGRFQIVNREWERVIGWRPDEMSGQDLLANMFPEVSTQSEALRYMLSPEPGWREFQLRVRDGRVLDTLWANVRLSDGTSIGIGQDITERKRLEAQFLQSQKMESVGRLAGGIAHDFNNLLTVIMGFAALSLADLPPDHPSSANLLEIRRASERAARLTRQLLAFARKQVFSLQLTNLNRLIVDVDRLLRRLIGENIELVVLPAADLVLVNVDPHQIEQVLVNLVLNARDAMPHGGQVTIESSNVVVDGPGSQHPAGLARGTYAMLCVVDNGVGMDATTRAHLFEPFFTTKGPDKGTGLGLATCYGIIQQHEGYISVDSTVGVGTRVTIYLPAAQVFEPGASPVLGHGPLPRGSETILLVEDETSVRRLTSRLLSDLGYRVIEARHGEEALQLAQTSGLQSCDLLLTDVIMPSLGGTELAARLLALRPGLRVVFMSGYADDQFSERGEPQAGAGFLQKPFSQVELAYKLREVLDRPAMRTL